MQDSLQGNIQSDGLNIPFNAVIDDYNEVWCDFDSNQVYGSVFMIIRSDYWKNMDLLNLQNFFNSNQSNSITDKFKNHNQIIIYLPNSNTIYTIYTVSKTDNGLTIDQAACLMENKIMVDVIFIFTD